MALAVTLLLLAACGSKAPTTVNATPTPVRECAQAVPGDSNVSAQAGSFDETTLGLENCGLATWQGYVLQSQLVATPPNGAMALPGPIALPDLEPGQTTQVKYRVQVPLVAGIYKIQMRVVNRNGSQVGRVMELSVNMTARQ